LKIGIFALPFVPLVVTPSLLFPYVTGKGFAFRMITEVIFAAWILLALADRAYGPRTSALLWVLLAFVGVVGTTNLLGVDPTSSFWGSVARMDGYLALIHWLAFFLVVGSFLATEGLGERFLAATVIASSMVCLFSLGELAQRIVAGEPPQRLQATLGNPTFLGSYLLLQLFVAIFLTVRLGDEKRRVLGWIARLIIGLHLVVIFLSGTRGAVLGLVAGAVLAILIVAGFERRGERSRASAREALGALLIVLVGFFLFEVSGNVPRWAGPTTGSSSGQPGDEADPGSPYVATGRSTGEAAPSSASDLGVRSLADETPASSLIRRVSAPLQRLTRIGTAGSVQIRLALWEMAMRGFRDRPLTGWGQENFDLVADRHFLASFPTEDEWVDRPHNTLLEWCVSGGVVAGILYLAIFIAAGWVLWSPAATMDLSTTQRSVLTGLLCAHLVSSLFLFDTVPTYLAFFSVLAYLHSVATRNRPPTSDECRQRGLARANQREGEQDGLESPAGRPGLGKPWLLAVAALLCTSTAWALYQLDVRPILAAHAGRRAAVLVAVDPEASLAEFRRALGYGTFAGPAVRERLILAAVDSRVMGAPAHLAGKYAELAELEWAKELSHRPERSRARALMGVFMRERGQPERAIAYLESAVTLSPTRRGHYFRLSDAYQQAGRPEAALDWAERGYGLDPSRRRSRLRYATAAVYAGRDDLVEELLIPTYGTTLVRNEQLSRAYISMGRSQEIIDAWRARIGRDNLDLEAHRGLAEFLILAGRREEAARELRTLQLMLQLGQ
jgi:tetratricopeptide (TPR) repeat protein